MTKLPDYLLSIHNTKLLINSFLSFRFFHSLIKEKRINATLKNGKHHILLSDIAKFMIKNNLRLSEPEYTRNKFRKFECHEVIEPEEFVI